MLSLMLTEHNLSEDELTRFARGIKAGRSPVIPESERVKLRPAIEQAKVMMGMKQPHDPATGSGKRRLFNSPGLTWPFLAAVAALIIFWTLYWGSREW